MKATRTTISYRTAIFDLPQSLIHTDMSVRETFSRVSKDIKDRLKGSKRNKGRKRPGTSQGGADFGESLSRSESPVVGGGNRDPAGSGASTVVGRIGSTDRPVQQDGSDPGSAEPNGM